MTRKYLLASFVVLALIGLLASSASAQPARQEVLKVTVPELFAKYEQEQKLGIDRRTRVNVEVTGQVKSKEAILNSGCYIVTLEPVGGPVTSPLSPSRPWIGPVQISFTSVHKPTNT